MVNVKYLKSKPRIIDDSKLEYLLDKAPSAYKYSLIWIERGLIRRRHRKAKEDILTFLVELERKKAQYHLFQRAS